jgi:hypothetical protein
LLHRCHVLFNSGIDAEALKKNDAFFKDAKAASFEKTLVSVQRQQPVAAQYTLARLL